MSEPYEVVTSGKWPSGSQRTAAVLDKTVEEVESFTGRQFLPGSDDLGPFVQCGLRLASGRLVLLQQYHESPDPGPTVWIDSADDPAGAVDELLAAFEWDRTSVSWMAPKQSD